MAIIITKDSQRIEAQKTLKIIEEKTEYAKRKKNYKLTGRYTYSNAKKYKVL